MDPNFIAMKHLLKFKDRKIEEQRVAIDILVNTVQAVQERNSNLMRELHNLKNKEDREG